MARVHWRNPMRTAKTLASLLFAFGLLLPVLGTLGCGGEDNSVREAMVEVEDEIDDAADEMKDEIDDRT